MADDPVLRRFRFELGGMAYLRVDHANLTAHLPDGDGRALDDAPELLELRHQVDLGVQTTRGVDEHEVGVAGRTETRLIDLDERFVRLFDGGDDA